MIEQSINVERMEQVLISLGKAELQQMIDEGKGAELTCQFCRKHYNFNEEELEKLFGEAIHV